MIASTLVGIIYEILRLHSIHMTDCHMFSQVVLALCLLARILEFGQLERQPR